VLPDTDELEPLALDDVGLVQAASPTTTKSRSPAITDVATIAVILIFLLVLMLFLSSY
jgi:hypothetical protein